jgi:STE24 endopeptidase
MIRALCTAVLASMLLLLVQSAGAADALTHEFPPGLIVPPGAQMSPDFDVDKATHAYMDLLTPAQRARSDAYFEGGYWLQLWGFLYSLGVAWLLLGRRRSARLRDGCERIARRRWLQVFIYSAIYVLAAFLVAAYSFVRKFANSWWIWLSGFTVAFLLVVTMIAPVWIMPLFNDYKVLADGPVKSAVLSMARANGVPADNVYWFDASKQSNRVSATGFLGTTRVSLNDNLLNKTSLPEVKAVMGHELGHYVLHHPLRGAIYYGIVFGLGFAFIHWSARGLIQRWRDRFALRDIGDVAALPLMWALFSTFLIVATPVLNSISRQQETEADIFGLNAAREPHGFAMAAMRLSSYRKMQPTAIEEMVFYDHPSGYTRVYDSMRWLKENPSAAEKP